MTGTFAESRVSLRGIPPAKQDGQQRALQLVPPIAATRWPLRGDFVIHSLVTRLAHTHATIPTSNLYQLMALGLRPAVQASANDCWLIPPRSVAAGGSRTKFIYPLG